jgi:tetratricopeptide (TPR) repeat protein
MAELALKFWLLQTFVTTSLGLIHYSGLLEAFYNLLYGSVPPTSDQRLQALLRTFVGARSMLSTILNTQFFGNYLMMALPVVASAVVIIFRNLKRRLAAGESPRVPMTWATIAGLTFVFSLTCLFATYAKSSIFLLPILLAAYGLAVYLYGGLGRIPYLWLIIPLGALMGGTVLFFTWADLLHQLTDVSDSAAPRRIIFGGAWQIFLDHPVLGAGPGSFRIYFPEYRSPDYHLTRISNVTIYAHNWLLDLLCQNGILGTAAYLTFLGGGLWLGWKALHRCEDSSLRIAVIGCLVGVASLLAGSSVTPMSGWPVGSVALHAMIGTALGVTLVALRGPGEPVGPARRWGNQAAGQILLVCAVLFAAHSTAKGVRLFRAAYYHNEGLVLSEGLPAHIVGSSAVITDPRVVPFFRAAETNFRRALELDPTRLTTYYKLAHVYNRLGESENALKAYRELQRYAPDYAEVHYNLAVIHYNLSTELAAAGDTRLAREHADAATSYFARAAKLSNKVSVWFSRATAYLHAAERYPVDSEERRSRNLKAAEVFLETTSKPVARVIQEAGQTEREEEMRLRSWAMAADAFARAGDWARAAEVAEEYSRRAPDNLAHLQLTVTYYERAGNSEAAIRLLDQAIARNPFEGDLYLLKYRTLSEHGDPSEALAHGHYIMVLQEQLSERGINFLTPEKVNALRSLMRQQARQIDSRNPS